MTESSNSYTGVFGFSARQLDEFSESSSSRLQFIADLFAKHDLGHDAFFASLHDLAERRKEEEVRVEAYELLVKEIEAEIGATFARRRQNYVSIFSELGRFRSTIGVREIYALWMELCLTVPEFQQEDSHSRSLEKAFLKVLDIEPFLWDAICRRWYDWDDLDNARLGDENGEKIYGVVGGLEMYQDIFPFEEDLFLPPKGYPCVYFLRDRNMNILYIGQSKRIKQRLADHWKEQKKPGIEIFDVIRIRDSDLLTQEEHRMIMKYQPPYNKTMKRDLYTRHHFVDGQHVNRYPWMAQ